jgi:putative oxygen-independent coproporphyrinogen III oxidase
MQVYLHYPYCATLCPYCDFFSATGPEDPAYARTIARELELWARHVDGPVTTVYFGGGTPGRMAPALTAQLIARIDALFGLDASAEITLETNPDDITIESLRDFALAGINRLSIGVQSLDDAELKQLGRRHDAQQAIDAVGAARQTGFTNLSLDLIFGLPGQTQAGLAVMLERFFALGSEHVSLYGLTIEEGTKFGTDLAAGRFVELDRVTWLQMYEQVSAAAEAHGLRRYEISNFARPGFSSRHNRAYWRDGSFVGVGPGAHGQRRLFDGALQRRFNPRSLRGWATAVDRWSLNSDFLDDPQSGETLSSAQWLREAAMVGLRDLDLGIDPAAWLNTFSIADPILMATVEKLIKVGDLTRARPHCLTPQAQQRVDRVGAALLNA